MYAEYFGQKTVMGITTGLHAATTSKCYTIPHHGTIPGETISIPITAIQ